MTKELKTKAIPQIRCTPEYHAMVSKRARSLGLTISAYLTLCLEHGHEAVVKVVEERESSQ